MSARSQRRGAPRVHVSGEVVGYAAIQPHTGVWWLEVTVEGSLVGLRFTPQQVEELRAVLAAYDAGVAAADLADRPPAPVVVRQRLET